MRGSSSGASSPSPSKPSLAQTDVNSMTRSQRINPDSVADGGGSGASRNPAAPAPAPKPSKDERAPDVVVDTSRLAPYFPRTSLENRPASSSAALLSHLRYNVAMDTSHSQGPNLGSGGGSRIALSDSPLPLQWWGHGKRSRSRRQGPVAEPELTRAEVRRQKSLKYRSRRAAKAKARAAMAPPGARGPNLGASPSPPPRAGTLWLHGYPRINSDSLPLADGSGGSVILRPVALTPGPTQSKVERTSLVVTDTSCLMSYFGRTSLEHHMTRGRPTSSTADHLYNVGMNTYQGPNVGGGSGGDIVHTPLEQHRLWGHAPHLPQPAHSPIAPVSHHLLNHAMHTSQGPNVSGDGGNGIASPNDVVPLQWGQRKRSRSRREAPAPTPAPKPELTPAKVQAVKPMVSSGARGPNLISDLSLAPRAVTLSLRSSAEELHNTVGEQQPTLKEEKVMPPPSVLGPIICTISPHAATLSHHSSLEEPRTAAGEKQPAAKEEKQQPAVDEEKQQPAPKGKPKKQQQPQRQESIKATAEQKGKAPMVEVRLHVEEEEEEKAAMARPVVPRVVTQLTHEEKEEDWLAMTGTKLPRFPHRRPEIVQKQVNNICPGEWLWQANRTRYKVKEKKSEKRVGGLKGMVTDDEDSDSDSD